MDDDKKKELANGFEFLTKFDTIPNALLRWAYLPTVRELDVVQVTSHIRQIILDAVTNNANVIFVWRSFDFENSIRASTTCFDVISNSFLSFFLPFFVEQGAWQLHPLQGNELYCPQQHHHLNLALNRRGNVAPGEAIDDSTYNKAGYE